MIEHYLPVLVEFLLADVQQVVSLLFGGAADRLEKFSASTMQPSCRDHQLRRELVVPLDGHASQRSTQLVQHALESF